MISLKPNEKFLVNGALLANGPKRGQICIEGNDVNVLRLSDVIHPDTVRTPVTRLYHTLQTILSGDMMEATAKIDIADRYEALAYVFENSQGGDKLALSRRAWEGGRHYSALCHLKPLIALETALFAAMKANQSREDQPVAMRA
jgi:flagellar protein FlbT